MTLVNFPGHCRARCEERCSQCENYGSDCMLEVLFLCSRCGGVEGSLPTHCPGTRMTPEQMEDVQDGSIDYSHGVGWHVSDGRPINWKGK